MGFLRSPISEEDKEGETNQSFQDLRKENYSVEKSLTNPEDFFVDSLLDFDFLRDWMASDDGCEDRVLSSLEKVELDAMESGTMKCDGFSDKRKVDVLGDVGKEKSEMEMGGDVSCAKVTVEEGSVGDGCGKLGDLRCLIEEEMGKVSLDGVSNGSVSALCSVNAFENGDLDDANKIGGKEGGVNDIVASVEAVNAVGNGIECGVAGKNGVEAVIIDGNEAKSEDQECDQDESDSDSESESEDESESEGSSSSSSSSSNDDDDDEEEEEGVEYDRNDDDDEEEEEGVEYDRKKEGECAMVGGESEEADEEVKGEMEEGEIVLSDVDEMVGWSDNEDDGDIVKGPIRSKNEITVLPPVPPVTVTLQPHHQTLPVGAVLSIMGSQVVIEGVKKHNPLSEGSILWITESRSPLGIVDEIFGPVKNPYYIVRYNSESEVPTGILPGASVSFVTEFANHVLNDKSLYQKGYDASGANDEEVLGEEEFSDDEKEAEYRKIMKMKKRGTNDEKIGNKKNDKKKSKNRSGNWKTAQVANPQVPFGQGNAPADHSKHQVPPVIPLPNQGNHQSSSSLGYGSVSQPGIVPPFSQMGMSPDFKSMPPGGGNGIPFQQPQNIGIPGLPANNGMPWMQPVQPPPMYQMPLQSGLPFQQQIDAGSNLPLILSGGFSSFGATPGLVPLATYLNQGMFNHSPFGIVGAPGQQTPLPMNLGEQAMPSNMPQMGGYNQSFQPDNNAVSGNSSMRPSFNHGRYSGRGRTSHRRGGRRFGSGGRGRQQSC